GAAGIGSRCTLGIVQAHGAEVGLESKNKYPALEVIASLTAPRESARAQLLCSSSSYCRHAGGGKIASWTEYGGCGGIGSAIGASDISTNVKAFEVSSMGSAHRSQGQENDTRNCYKSLLLQFFHLKLLSSFV